MQAAVNVMFTHNNSKKGIKLFGERDISEMINEFKQLYEGEIPGNPVVIPLNPDEITYAKMRQALYSVNLIKEKINGIIKVRTCANGSKKRYLKYGKSVASLTVFLEGLLTTLVINAYEGI